MPRYRAFISYCHEDARWAGWLHRQLEGYRLPRRLRGSDGEFGPLPERLSPIFRDRDDLASSGELGERIQAALADSAALIVICSPAAARSHWVNQEILSFKRTGDARRIYCLIVDGEPNSGDERECFPKPLRFALDANGELGDTPVELIAADLRPGRDGRSLARLRLLAGLLGVDLDRLRQREMQRRHARMVGVLVLAAAITVLMAVLAVQAVVARKAAERRQKQAENLVGFMLGDLNDKLAQVQRLDILEAVDDKAMDYFQSLPTVDVTDESLAQRAKALQKIGSVRLDQGHLPAALKAYEASAALSGKLADAAPGDTARQLAHAENLAFIGTTHWYQGKLDAAQSSFRSAQALLKSAQPDAGHRSELLYQLATIDNNIGHVLEARGRLDEAEVEYRNMLAASISLAKVDPGNTEWQLQLAAAHNNLGKLALMRGDLATALAQYAADDAIETKLAADHPKDDNLRSNLMVIRAILGRTRALVGDLDAGRRGLGEAVAIATELSDLDPGNAGARELRALYSTQLARLHRLAGDPAAAGALVTRALGILAELVKQDPANPGWQRELAEARIEQAALQHLAGDLAAARASVAQAGESLGPLLAAEPDDRSTLLSAIAAEIGLADLQADAAAARAGREKAVALARGSASARKDPRLLALEVEALVAMGRASEAGSLIEGLRLAGYRDRALLSVLERARIAYPVHEPVRQRLEVAAPTTGPR
jgi:tetratricopeptide (TPR) repeat protein